VILRTLILLEMPSFIYFNVNTNFVRQK